MFCLILVVHGYWLNQIIILWKYLMNDLVGCRGYRNLVRNKYEEGKRPGAVVKQFRALLLHFLLSFTAYTFVMDSWAIFLLVWFVFYDNFICWLSCLLFLGQVDEPRKWGYSADRKKVFVYFFGTQQMCVFKSMSHMIELLLVCIWCSCLIREWI